MSPIPSEHMLGKKPTVAERAQAAAHLAGSYTLLEPVADEMAGAAGTGPRVFAKRVDR